MGYTEALQKADEWAAEAEKLAREGLSSQAQSRAAIATAYATIAIANRPNQ